MENYNYLKENTVHATLIPFSLEKKLEYCIQYNADVLIMGADHTGRFDYLKQHNIDVVYYPRTKGISTTEIVKKTIINVTPFLKI